MKTTMSQGEKWRQYGVMVHDTPETLGGMLRIENGNGDAIAFAIDHETANRITNGVNCHADLLSALQGIVENEHKCTCEGECDGQCWHAIALRAIDRATTQKEGAK